MTQPLDLGDPLRDAIIANAAITSLLGVWTGEPAVFTRRPVPASAPYPLILISPDISIGDVDGLTTRLPVPRRDITVFGHQPAQYRVVESIGYLLRAQFHRVRASIQVPGYSVVDITVNGPRVAPSDDQKILARACLLVVKLRDLAT